MDAQLTAFAARIEKITSEAALKRIAEAGGMAAKVASLAAASSDLGGDRSFSGGLGGGASLEVDFDRTGGSAVKMNYRPGGLWRIAESGRRSSGVIHPRRARALRTPDGPRASSRFFPSRGLGTYKEAVTISRRVVSRAAFKQFQSEIRKAM